MLDVIDLLENIYLRSQVFCRHNRISCRIYLYFAGFALRLPHKPSRTYWSISVEVFPQRDAATIMLHSGDSEFLMMCSVAYAKHAI